MPAAAPRHEPAPVSHNLSGQRLGRKGRGTRERILAAAERLLAGPADTPISLSAVAREASLGMTALYRYFADLGELLLAVLDPIVASARGGYVSQLAERWPEDRLAGECLRFVRAYHAFWRRHTRVLHLRNALADGHDDRMMQQRIAHSQPLIALLAAQMRSAAGGADPPHSRAMASVLLTGIERVVTVTTDEFLAALPMEPPADDVDVRLRMQARLLELGIRDCRDGDGAA